MKRPNLPADVAEGMLVFIVAALVIYIAEVLIK